MSKFLGNISYVVLLLANILSAVWFSFYSDGLYSYESGTLFRCEELMSSGGDGEVTMLYFVIMLVPLVLRIAFFSKRPSLYEVLVFMGLFGVGILFVCVASDCGDLITTAFLRRSLYVCLFLCTGACSALLLIFLHATKSLPDQSNAID